MSDNTNPMEQGEGVDLPIQEKPSSWKFSGMSETTQNSCFLFPHFHWGFGPNSLKISLELHEIPRTPQKSMFSNLHLMEKGIVPYH